MCTTAAVTTRMTRPHQLPSISHPSERQARKTSTKLTSGINIPIDFKASIVHKVHRAPTVEKIVDRPRIATSAASPAARDALSHSAPADRSGLTSAVAGKVDIQIVIRAAHRGS